MKIIPLLYNRFLSRNPFYIVLHITYRCNARCDFCFNWKKVSGKNKDSELTIDELGEIATQLGRFQQLTISGGEPFLRPDIADIASLFHRHCQVQNLTIPTNGLLTDRIAGSVPKIIRNNKKLHLRMVLSMSEAGQRIDALFKVKGASQMQAKTYKYLRNLMKTDANLSISVNIVCNKGNIHRLGKIFDFIEREIDCGKPYLTLVRGEPENADLTQMNIDDVVNSYNLYNERFNIRDNMPFKGAVKCMTRMVNDISVRTLKENKAQLTCRCGEKLVVIYENGDVFPCEYLKDAKIGNLREYRYDLKAILNSDRARAVTDKIINEKCYCTWECANYNNVLFSRNHLLRLTKDMVNDYFKH